MRPCTFLFYSISFFLFFSCLSLNNRQVRVISTLLDTIVNLCFARSPRAKGSNFRTCAIAACPGFRASPLMRMSMNRTLPDLPFACPGRSGYEISAFCQAELCQPRPQGLLRGQNGWPPFWMPRRPWGRGCVTLSSSLLKKNTRSQTPYLWTCKVPLDSARHTSPAWRYSCQPKRLSKLKRSNDPYYMYRLENKLTALEWCWPVCSNYAIDRNWS